ncbi:phosphomevalonate kinase [Candidatus Woesearchaeota archaeon]|nr:phosphomevalonate kinase [Candidatus Woesearchaeota archaeon]
MEITVPGKVMLAGEWNVLLPGHSCIAFAVNIYARCQIISSSKFTLSFEPFNYKTQFSIQKNKLVLQNQQFRRNEKINNERANEDFSLALKGVEIALQYLSLSNINLKHFTLTVDTSSFYHSSNNHYNNHLFKIGLGSSAASLVGIITSVLVFHRISVKSFEEKLVVFKLSSIALLSHHYPSSCYDLATCIFGDMIYYTSFDTQLFIEKIKGKSLQEILSPVFEGWGGLNIKHLNCRELPFLIYWTEKSSSTISLVNQVYTYLDQHKQDSQLQTSYLQIMDDINSLVHKLLSAINNNHFALIVYLIRQNRELLLRVEKLIGVVLETPDIHFIVDDAYQHGCSAKLSGAGGGDIAIVVSQSQSVLDNFKSDLSEKGIYPLPLLLGASGVCYE